MKIFIVFVALFAITLAAQNNDNPKPPTGESKLVGGFSKEYFITPGNETLRDTSALQAFNASIPQIEELIGQLPTYEVKSYRMQVVAGTRYLYRVQVNSTTLNDFIHVSVWQQINRNVILGQVVVNKTELLIFGPNFQHPAEARHNMKA